MWDGGESFVAGAYSSLQAHVDKGRLAYAMKRVQELVKKLEGHRGGIVGQLRAFLTDSLGRPAADEAELQSAWLALQAELSRLTALLPSLQEISRVTAAIEAAGASKWAKRLRTQEASADVDAITPANWLDAWNWRQAVMFLDTIDGHHKVRELFDERRALTTALARTYQELVAEKTWLGVFHNSPDSVRQALQAYLNAVQAMGAGTGVRAVRHRKSARDAMVRAYQAVPCWVLPQWRVSETIPADVGLFDLVVIDEASQSDIWALPALLRGKKVLVVGDHKQVSPSAVGTAEEKIKELVSRFLTNQPHGSEMTPDKSIYDLARVVFAGNSVMLKEHFRCVPAIIEFSNREFYQGDIRPLRVPKANERLDPPLVDVFVKGGYRKGDVNDPEAKAIVDEIESILADPLFEGRSIGVVTLLGTSQAALIHEMVSERISPIDFVARKIAIGPPPVFQGRERDIMLVSMVLGSGDRAAANRADMHQRFNVALSRARDRMYLFRSVGETEFREDSLNGKVISHFKQPFRQDAKKVQALREKCESGFEFEMFDELVKRGFRVEPQVPCGGYRIDFVVEGNEGRRLAIECDGDRFHGPGQWQGDMMRQRVLERAGWTFWRCFASSFVRRREAVLTDLMQTLQKLGIEPLGAETVDNTVWVHYKEVDPYGVEADEEQEVA
jgi:very-short-patch-repair endonuclease